MKVSRKEGVFYEQSRPRGSDDLCRGPLHYAELAAGRDRSQYRDKGKRATTIKTVYGEVSYSRRVYQTRLEDGQKAYVYLLDDAMHMDRISGHMPLLDAMQTASRKVFRAAFCY